MERFPWKFAGVTVVLLTAALLLVSTFKPGVWPNKEINLGLDLQGGMHLVLEVQSEEAVKNRVNTLSMEVKAKVKSEHIRRISLDWDKGREIAVRIRDRKNAGLFETLFEKEFENSLDVKSKSVETDGTEVVILRIKDEEADQIKKMAVEQALETIRNRIDQFGVAEPDIRIQGERRILIQLPGISDAERAKDLIGKTAMLEFKLVNTKDSVDGTPPPGEEILFQDIKNEDGKVVNKKPWLVKKRASLTGTHLIDAKVNFDQYNEPYVGIRFDKKGAKIFETVTGDNVNELLAIVLDNKVYSAPQIQGKIAGGDAQITGRFSMDEAHDLSIALRSGSLPAPVEILEERTVGPSLGDDSIQAGLMSMCVGGVLVIFFMLIYYKGSGLIADIALILNIFLIGAGLAAFSATLTLPGIAGIILTIGMAVDANVLIFERIREELHIGKTPRAALEAGYDRATLTILDANITTLIAALVLFQFGTGPIKGFAVTLSLGVVSSLFTSLVITRMIFDYFLVNRKAKSISI